MHEYLIGYLQASESDDWKHEIATEDIRASSDSCTHGVLQYIITWNGHCLGSNIK